MGLHLLAGDSVDKLVPKPIACLLVDLSKRDALVLGESRVQGDGAGDERESFKKPFQSARGAKSTLHTHQTTTFEMVIRALFLSPSHLTISQVAPPAFHEGRN